MGHTAEPERYDCIVIGSGFGGAVTACRLAEQGRSVLVLERGESYRPGTFPRTPLALSTNVWDPAQRRYGMFDIWSFRSFEAIVCAGLGGGSLIYANVLLRKPPEWFEPGGGGSVNGGRGWPVRYADLEAGYAKAEAMLAPQPYPYVETTEKTRQFRDAAADAGLTWRPVPLAISFSPPGQHPGVPLGRPEDNLHGAARTTCQLCGQCNVGCNYGSKNTTDLTYLSVAARHGARIETLHEVRQIRPQAGGDGYEVVARRHQPPKPRWQRDGDREGPESVTFSARTVVVSAGSLGSTFLLLRNRARLPDLSPTLGTRFSQNGDYLGFISAPGSRVFDSSQAPVITGYLAKAGEPSEPGSPGARAALADAVNRGYIVQDGGYPVLADWLSEALGIKPIVRVARTAWTLARARVLGTSSTEISSKLSDIVGDARRSRSVVPMLGMGCDSGDGRLSLKNGSLDASWKKAYSEPVFRPIRGAMSAMAGSLGGRFHDGPSSILSRMITVHPLGGVPMGRSVDHGVVDDHGEVFNYPGLFVADGSVVPGPTGVNPALTIAALAERFSDRLLERTSP